MRILHSFMFIITACILTKDVRASENELVKDARQVVRSAPAFAGGMLAAQVERMGYLENLPHLTDASSSYFNYAPLRNPLHFMRFLNAIKEYGDMKRVYPEVLVSWKRGHAILNCGFLPGLMVLKPTMGLVFSYGKIPVPLIGFPLVAASHCIRGLQPDDCLIRRHFEGRPYYDIEELRGAGLSVSQKKSLAVASFALTTVPAFSKALVIYRFVDQMLVSSNTNAFYRLLISNGTFVCSAGLTLAFDSDKIARFLVFSKQDMFGMTIAAAQSMQYVTVFWYFQELGIDASSWLCAGIIGFEFVCETLSAHHHDQYLWNTAAAIGNRFARYFGWH